MNTFNLKESMEHLNKLKEENATSQKKGLPFMMAAVLLWTIILIIRLLDINIGAMNLATFCCSVLLLPLAFVFSKVLKADIFKKMENPIAKLGFLATLNQMLYIVIVMWAYSDCPQAMLMIYAMVFGAHLLPFGWLYDTKSYTVVSIVETIAAMVINLVFGAVAMAAFMIVMQIILSIVLFTDVRKVNEISESRDQYRPE
ncbi:MAG: hypothetical protein K6A97_05680 [Lachnospiraceae bacterium]|nr:hypothetical protein [Lachnospiraceae bacterium]